MEEELTGIVWATREGYELDLAIMSDEHLINAYKMVVRNWPWREAYIIPMAQEMKLRGLPWYGEAPKDVLTSNHIVFGTEMLL